MKVSTTLNAEMSKRFQAVKEYTGVKANNNVLILLITKEYQRIQQTKTHRVFLSNETYDVIEEIAKTRGQTVDEYVEEITEDLLRKEKENVLEHES